MRLVGVEHRYRFEFAPGSQPPIVVAGTRLEISGAVVETSKVADDVETFTTTIYGFALTGTRRGPLRTIPTGEVERELERQLVEHVRTLRGRK